MTQNEKPDSPYPARQIAVSINCSVNDAYAFASDPRNLPRWAAGLADFSIQQNGADWVATSPMGPVRIRFAPQNDFGVLDHDVTLADGETNHNPFRIVRNASGCTAIFTLYRYPRMGEDAWDRDAKMVDADLQRLKALLENRG